MSKTEKINRNVTKVKLSSLIHLYCPTNTFLAKLRPNQVDEPPSLFVKNPSLSPKKYLKRIN